MTADWRGVYPAVTTQFRSDQSLDLEATAAHVERLIGAGCHGVIMLGTLGESQSLEWQEKRDVVMAAIDQSAGRVPVLAGVAETASARACRFAGEMEKLGAGGLMVLPGLLYKSDARETLSHFREVARASDLPVMIYNNPITYGIDVTPEMFGELADEETVVAIKESSDDVRRITDLVNLCGERYRLFCGVDDLALEAFLLGAEGWVAGLVNAFPAETVRIWDLAQAGRWEEARALYRWFAPLLHLDTHPKLVQYIKLAQAMAGMGGETVRAPRLALEGAERARIVAVIEAALAERPKLAA